MQLLRDDDHLLFGDQVFDANFGSLSADDFRPVLPKVSF